MNVYDEKLIWISCTRTGILRVEPILEHARRLADFDQGASFARINDIFAESTGSGVLFELRRPPEEVDCACDVFLLKTGVFVIYCGVTHTEDRECAALLLSLISIIENHPIEHRHPIYNREPLPASRV